MCVFNFNKNKYSFLKKKKNACRTTSGVVPGTQWLSNTLVKLCWAATQYRAPVPILACLGIRFSEASTDFFFFPKKLFRRKLKEGLEPKPKVFPTRCTPWLCPPLREIQKRMQTDGSWDSRVGILKSGKGLKIPMSSAFLPTNSPLYSAYNHWTLFLRIHLQMYLKVKMIISEEDRHSTSPMHFALRH